jgi:cold shock CspA family protein
VSRIAGVVAEFDVDIGLGVIRPDGGGPELPFHCVAIADGSRRIDIGAAVEFELIAKLGRHEAWSIAPR